MFRELFEQVVRQCLLQGLVKGEGFATDASVIKADANRQRGIKRNKIADTFDPETASRPVQEYLDAIDQENASYYTTQKNVSLTDPQSR